MLEVSVVVFLLQGYLTSGREVGTGHYADQSGLQATREEE